MEAGGLLAAAAHTYATLISFPVPDARHPDVQSNCVLQLLAASLLAAVMLLVLEHTKCSQAGRLDPLAWHAATIQCIIAS